MSDSLTLVSALFAATPKAPIPVECDGVAEPVTDSAYFEHDSAGRYVSPLTDQGVAFVFAEMEHAAPDAWHDCLLPATAVLRKDQRVIVCWVLEQPEPPEAVQPLTEFFGMQGTDEPIPLPSPDGWELVYVDKNIFHSLSALLATYLPPPAPAPEPQAPAEAKYGDARLLTPYDENEPRYQREMTVTFGNGKEARNWKPMKMSTAAFIGKLAEHRMGKKDGPAFVLADMVQGQRLKNSVKALYGVGLDIDTGTPARVIDAALVKLGALAIRYTTHSHAKTETEFKKDKITKFAPDVEIDDDVIRRFLQNEQWDDAIVAEAVYERTDHTDKGIVVIVGHPPMPKHRVILPFVEPFEIAKEAPTQVEAMKKWAKVPTALAAALGVPLDKSCTDPSRLFYLPRHDKGRSFEITLIGGNLFDWHSLELDDPFEGLVAEVTKGKGKSVTQEGRDLGRWSMKRAHGFQIADVVEAHAPDKIRGNASQGFDVECPFDEDHSNAGSTDDRACFIVNAGTGQSEFFTISCRHEGCRNKTNLDMLGKMIKDGWFGKEILVDEQYNAAILEDAPQPEVAAKLEKEDKATAALDAAIDALTPDTGNDAMEAVIALVLDSKAPRLDSDRAKERIANNMKVKLATIKNYFKSAEVARVRQAGKNAGARKDEIGRAIFPYSGEYNFDEAAAACFRALKGYNESKHLPVICHIDGDPVRLVMETKDGISKVKFRYIESKALWSELNLLLTFVRRSDEGDGSRGCVPLVVADHVYQQCYGNLRAAPEVLYTPVFLADGSLMVSAKYHYSERDLSGNKLEEPMNILMIHNDLKVPEVLEEPTSEDVERAVDWIRTELLSDFPFLDYDLEGNERRESSEAAAFAMLITPFMRRMIKGRTPVFFVKKPKAGTGGTLIGKLPMMLFDGTADAPTRYSQNEEEMQKQLISAIMNQRSHLFFDDVKDFNSRELLRAITSDNIGGRILGSSKNIEVPNRFNWIGTGNNTIIHDEMRRRVVFICMNAKLANIQGRQFRHPDVSGLGYEEFVCKNRGIAICHILTMIQYWLAVKAPIFDKRRRSGFEEWSAKVGGVLQVCGIEGFLDNLAFAEMPDMDDAASKQFVREVLKRFGADTAVKPSELFTWALNGELDIIEGSNEDQKKARFMKRLPFLEGQTFDIEEKRYTVWQTRDRDDNVAFKLSYTARATIESQDKRAA